MSINLKNLKILAVFVVVGEWANLNKTDTLTMTCNKYVPNKQGFVSANVNIPLNLEKKNNLSNYWIYIKLCVNIL